MIAAQDTRPAPDRISVRGLKESDRKKLAAIVDAVRAGGELEDAAFEVLHPKEAQESGAAP